MIREFLELVTQTSTRRRGVGTVPARRTTPVMNPYLHVSADCVHNPITDRNLRPPSPDFHPLLQVARGDRTPESLPGNLRARLQDQEWLCDPGDIDELSQAFHLKYVSLEAHTVCNQACYFCPVSISPRESHFMPMTQYREILAQLAAYRNTIEAIFMIAYNEPTLDRRFVDQVRAIRSAGLPPAALTNATGLTPERVDALVELGGLRFLSINLSTMDPARYAEDRGRYQVDMVLENLDYARNRPVAEQMDIVVLGPGGEQHQRDFEEISTHFAGSRFTVKHFIVNDRAGLLPGGVGANHGGSRLRGCDQMGSRPIQHLHIDPYGRCILCCQDYHGSYVVGDLSESTVFEVLTGPEMQRMRKLVYGIEDAPAGFICRNCPFALTE